MTPLLGILAVAVGGAVGSLGRWGLATLAARWSRGPGSMGVPWPTFAVNVLACFLLGMIVTWFGGAPDSGARLLYLLAAVGFCGGLSTLSSAALEIADLTRGGAVVTALGYLLLTAGACMAALWLGLMVSA